MRVSFRRFVVLSTAIATFAGLALTAPRARAQQAGFYSTNAALSGGSSMAYDRSGGAAWLNPAGLAGVSPVRLDASITAFVLRKRDLSRVAAAELSSGPVTLAANAIDVTPVPSALVFVRRLHPRLWGAFGVFVTEYDPTTLQAGKSALVTLKDAQGAPIEVPIAVRADLSGLSQTYRIGAAFGFDARPRLRLGVGLYASYGTVSHSATLSAYATDSLTAPTSYFTSQLANQLDGTVLGLQLVAGVQWNPVGGLHLGLTVRSPALGLYSGLRYHMVGQKIASGSFFPGSSSIQLDDGTLPSGTGTLLEPTTVIGGLAWKGDRFAISGEVDYVHALEATALNLTYADQVNVRLGAQGRAGKALVLGGGLFSDRGSRRTYRYLGDSTVDYYGAALSLGFDSSYPLAPAAASDPGAPPRALVFTTVLTATYEYGVASVSGVRYAPTSVKLEDISALTPVASDAVFGLWGLQITSSMSF